MSKGIGPTLYPISVDVFNADQPELSRSYPKAKAFVTYTGDQLTHIQVYDTTLQKVVDEDVTAAGISDTPMMVHTRHSFELATGEIMLVQMLGGCGCGSQLRGLVPFGATAGRRP